MATGSRKSRLADEEPARGDERRHRHTARADPRISFYLALPGVRGIPGERERKPTGSDGTRGQEYQGIADESQQHVSPLASDRHRRGTLRRSFRLRSAERTPAAVVRIRSALEQNGLTNEALDDTRWRYWRNAHAP